MAGTAQLTPPIPLPDGRTLITLHDAATFIMNLPKRRNGRPLSKR